MKMRAAVAAACLALDGATALTQTPPVFSSRVVAVRVDVLVTDRGRLVRGLGPADFEVLDNGVAQQVDLVSFEQLPLNVVLVLDMSDSVAGERLSNLRNASLALLDQLAPQDQAALVTFSHGVTIRAPLTADRSRVRAALESPAGRGQTALADATHTGIVLAESGVGRSLLILFSDGFDTASWLPAGGVLETAKRTDVVAYCVSTRERRQSAFTEDLASITGGSRFEVDTTTDLSGAFLRILAEFRERYLVSYTPRGVPRDGWHRLDVRVKGRRLSVRARPGYLGGR